MNNKTIPTRRIKRSPSIGKDLYILLLLSGSTLLFFPSLPLRALLILGFGGLIYNHEKVLGMPIPASPGVMFWLGNVLSYVVGGLGTYYFLGPYYYFNLDYLGDALFYLGLGLASYAFGLWMAGRFFSSHVQKSPNITLNLNFRRVSIFSFGALFIIPVLVGAGLASRDLFTAYSNIILGAFRSIVYLPLILLSFYIIRHRLRIWEGLVMLATAYVYFIPAIMIGGGREYILKSGVAVLFVWLGLKWYRKESISLRTKLSIVLVPLILILLFGLVTTYRNMTHLRKDLSKKEMAEIAKEATTRFKHSGNIFVESIRPLVRRLVETPSIELLGWVENGVVKHVGWSWYDTKQLLLSWIPRVFFPEKGVGYGRDIMEYYGLCPSWNNIPVTVLTDTFRRFGGIGIVIVYCFMGFVSTGINLKLLSRWGVLGLVLSFYFALLHFRLYSLDTMAVFKLYIYRLPSSGLIIYLILKLTRMLPKRKITARF